MLKNVIAPATEQLAIDMPSKLLAPAPPSLIEQVARFAIIETPDVANEAAALVKEISAIRKGIYDDATKIVQQAHELHVTLTAKRKAAVAPYDELIDRLMGKIKTFQRIEAERVQREREAEAKRLREEAAAEKRKLEESLRAQGLRRDEARTMARETVNADIAQAESAASATPEPVRVAGLKTSVEYVGQLVNLKELCAAIGEGKAPPTFVKIDQAAINAYARQWRQNASIPGIAFRSQAKTTR